MEKPYVGGGALDAPWPVDYGFAEANATLWRCSAGASKAPPPTMDCIT